MALPYAPSQLNLLSFDASQAATATWLFSSPDATVWQSAYRIWIYNNTTGVLVMDTGWLTGTAWQFVISAGTLVNRTQYKWQIQYRDSAGNESPVSQYSLFTCSSTPTVSLTSPTAQQVVTSNTMTISATYSQGQGVGQQTYRVLLYASDMSVLQDSQVQYATTNQFTVYGLTSGSYYAEVIVTSADGLTATTGKVPFTVTFNGATQSPSIMLTPLPEQASMRIDWHNPKSIPGTYSGPGQVYVTGKFGQGLRIGTGERVCWSFASVSQFTYTSWLFARTSTTRSNQVMAHLRADSSNFVQIRYDPLTPAFVLDVCVNGVSTTSKSAPVTLGVGKWFFVSIRQTGTAVTAIIGYNGNLYTITPAPPTATTDAYGTSAYGTGSFTSNPVGVVRNVMEAYIGCSPVDGQEFICSIDQTHMTSTVMQDSDLYSLFLNSTSQQFGIQSLFLANFNGNLEGGDASPTPISSWSVIRTAGGVQKTIGNVTNANQITASFTDLTPLAGVTYQYSIVPLDPSGNPGTAQVATGAVQFDGWWLSDILTGASFQFNCEVQDAPTEYVDGRSETETNGQFPIIAYTNLEYRKGTLSASLVSGWNTTATPGQQFASLRSLIKIRRPLLLRNDEGDGMMVDAYDAKKNIPTRNHRAINKVDLSWTEVQTL